MQFELIGLYSYCPACFVIACSLTVHIAQINDDDDDDDGGK